MREYWRQDVDVVDQAILMWNAFHHVIDRFRERHPDWFFVRHEDLAEAPIEGFTALYERLALRMTDPVAQRIEAHSAPGNAGESRLWRHRAVRRDSRAAARAWATRLTPEEVERVRAGTASLAKAFGYAEDARATTT